MNSFFNQFLLETARPSHAGSEVDIVLAAFGKHPAWDDHIDDIGLETESLARAKQLLYVQGIGGQIDSGAWDKLPSDQVLAHFNHIFLWQRSGRFLLGRLWSSVDGKGRARYPMVVCFHSMGPPLEYALPHFLPELENLQHACMGATSADDVERIIHQTGVDALARIADQPWHGERADDSRIRAEQFLGRPEWGQDLEFLLRVFHQCQQQIGVYQEVHRLAGPDGTALKPQQIRVPLAAETAVQAMLHWSQFFLLQLPPDQPLLFTIPLGKTWMDATFGEPGTDDFFCLRATPAALPLASSIPYHLDARLRSLSHPILEAMRQGAMPWNTASSSPHAVGNRISSLLAEKARQVFRLVKGRRT